MFYNNNMIKLINNDMLTPRECNIIIPLIQGETNRQIADKLLISVSTVKAYVEKIYRKFNVHNRLELLIYALKNNIILLDDGE